MRWRLGVVGFPIEHSLSPALHEAGLSLAGLEGTSTRVALGQDQVEGLRTMLGTRFDALSVTMPLKGVAGALCDELDDAARRTGSVNSLLVADGVVHGACTDGQGFVDSLRAQFGAIVEGMDVVVLGAGGAARAIVDALSLAKVETVSISARNVAAATAIADNYANVRVDASPSRRVDLIVNTTPAGGRMDDDVRGGVDADTIAVDIAYEPRISNWRALHDRAGCRSANGLAMLAYQAALQMQWWWRVPIDAAALLEVIS